MLKRFLWLEVNTFDCIHIFEWILKQVQLPVKGSHKGFHKFKNLSRKTFLEYRKEQLTKKNWRIQNIGEMNFVYSHEIQKRTTKKNWRIQNIGQMNFVYKFDRVCRLWSQFKPQKADILHYCIEDNNDWRPKCWRMIFLYRNGCIKTILFKIMKDTNTLLQSTIMVGKSNEAIWVELYWTSENLSWDWVEKGAHVKCEIWLLARRSCRDNEIHPFRSRFIIIPVLFSRPSPDGAYSSERGSLKKMMRN